MKERTFFMLKPDGLQLKEQILNKIKPIAKIILKDRPAKVFVLEKKMALKKISFH